MSKKKYIILSSLGIVSILLGSLFYYNIVQGQGVGDYNPWYDINDDGKIDMQDVGTVARKFGTSGESINKTGLLLELLDRVDSLNASLLDLEAYLVTWLNTLETSLVDLQYKMNTLETDIVMLNATIVDLQSRVKTLENQMLPQGFMRAPAYDSEWINISQGEDLILTHNLNDYWIFPYNPSLYQRKTH